MAAVHGSWAFGRVRESVCETELSHRDSFTNQLTSPLNFDLENRTDGRREGTCARCGGILRGPMAVLLRSRGGSAKHAA